MRIAAFRARKVKPGASEIASHKKRKRGAALVFKNNRPKYKFINLEVEPDLELTDDEKIDIVARRIMQRFKPAFMELAK